MINLNEAGFNAKIFKPFNNGNEGAAEVTIAEVSKNSEKNYWVITYSDQNGSLLKDFYSYVDETHPNSEKWIYGQAVVLKHFWEVLSRNIQIPTFQNTTEMLDASMFNIKKHSAGMTFILNVEFDPNDESKKYLRRKKFVPFIETKLLVKVEEVNSMVIIPETANFLDS